MAAVGGIKESTQNFLDGQNKKALIGGVHTSTQSEAEIEILARFAVDEHNKKAKTCLVFRKVVKANVVVVVTNIEIKFCITIEVTDGKKTKVYEAQVVVKLLLKINELVEFKLIGDA
ncbi:hypothetical protein LguiB_031882 [Lonicera macranthoides]